MAKTIIDRIPEHKTYAEVFGGAAWILFKKQPSRAEVLNDLDSYLMNFYRVSKYHLDALVEEVATIQTGRKMFYMLRDELDRPMMTDIQKAAAYYYVQRQAFSGRPRNPSFASHAGRSSRCKASAARKILPQVADRLKSVTLENLPWERFIKLYDSPETFFFIDPPYMGHCEYRHNFKPDDFISLGETLKSTKGKWLLTHTDQPEIREMFKKFNIIKTLIPYTCNLSLQGSKLMQGKEVMITNY